MACLRWLFHQGVQLAANLIDPLSQLLMLRLVRRGVTRGAEANGDGRRWNKNVDFVTHLTGVIRSITYHRREKFKKSHENETYLESEITGLDADGQVFSPLESAPSNDTAADEALIANETENNGAHRLLRTFEKDSLATRVLQVAGMAGRNG